MCSEHNDVLKSTRHIGTIFYHYVKFAGVRLDIASGGTCLMFIKQSLSVSYSSCFLLAALRTSIYRIAVGS